MLFQIKKYSLLSVLGFFVFSTANATQITIVNMDGAGEGFNDTTSVSVVGGNNGTTLGEQRLRIFEHAARFWEAVINSNVEIRVEAKFDPLTCSTTSAVLGSAGTKQVFRDFPNAPISSTWYSTALANSIAGTDLSSSNDIAATFNSDIDNNSNCLGNYNWYYGLDGNKPSNSIELYSVVLHEIGHGLGFQTFVNTTTGAKFGTPGRNDAYMLNLEDHSLSKSWSSMTNNQRQASATDTADLHWTGTNVTSLVGSYTGGINQGHVQMYAPDPVEGGSSVSHFSNAVAPNELMEPFDTGPKQSVGLSKELFQDIGWSITTNATPVIGEVNDVSVDLGSPVQVNFVIGDNDHSFSQLTVTPTSSNASVINSGGLVVSGTGQLRTLTLSPTAAGTSTITLQVSDGTSSSFETFLLTVNSFDVAPVITEGVSTTVNMDEDASPTAFVLNLNATDVNGGTLTWSINSQALNGVANASGTGSSKSISYTPNSNYNGSDSFVVTVTDGTSLSDSITVNVNLSAQDDDPVITQGAVAGVSMSEDGLPTSFVLTLNASDPDGGVLTWSINAVASNGSATASGTGTSKSIGYIPNPNYNGSDSFIVNVTDDASRTDSILINVTISAQNDDPVISIITPVNGSDFIATDIVSFLASANDIEDGDISNNVEWNSSIDGVLGIGNINTLLSIGSHLITASITDSFGSTINENISINVQAVPVVTPDGDINNDGNVNIADILLATHHINNVVTLSASQIARSDFYPPGSPDGILNLSDLILLQKIVNNIP